MAITYPYFALAGQVYGYIIDGVNVTLDLEGVMRIAGGGGGVSPSDLTAAVLVETNRATAAEGTKASSAIVTALTTTVAGKADTTSVNTALALKADAAATTTALAAKADAAATTTALSGKASTTALSTETSRATAAEALLTPLTTADVGQFQGTATNNNATAGNIGQYISQNIPSGTPVTLTNTTPANIASISLPAGDWDVTGTVFILLAGGATCNSCLAWTSTTSATQPTMPNNGGATFFAGAGVVNIGPGVSAGTQRISIATPTTLYLGVSAGFTGGTATGYGFVRARRVR